jgi:hypothetical protein
LELAVFGGEQKKKHKIIKNHSSIERTGITFWGTRDGKV